MADDEPTARPPVSTDTASRKRSRTPAGAASGGPKHPPPAAAPISVDTPPRAQSEAGSDGDDTARDVLLGARLDLWSKWSGPADWQALVFSATALDDEQLATTWSQLQAMQPGTRVFMGWRLGASPRALPTGPIEWIGSIKIVAGAAELVMPPGTQHIKKGGGIAVFPPPKFDSLGRKIEVFVVGTKAPAIRRVDAVPESDLDLFSRPLPPPVISANVTAVGAADLPPPPQADSNAGPRQPAGLNASPILASAQVPVPAAPLDMIAFGELLARASTRAAANERRRESGDGPLKSFLKDSDGELLVPEFVPEHIRFFYPHLFITGGKLDKSKMLESFNDAHLSFGMGFELHSPALRAANKESWSREKTLYLNQVEALASAPDGVKKLKALIFAGFNCVKLVLLNFDPNHLSVTKHMGELKHLVDSGNADLVKFLNTHQLTKRATVPDPVVPADSFSQTPRDTRGRRGR